MQNVLDLSLSQLGEQLVAWGEQLYRARQIFQHVYAFGARDFSSMHTLPKRLQQQLRQQFVIALPQIVGKWQSEDGSCKYRLVGSDGCGFEAVFIPEVSKSGRTHTLCISSQTGCAVGCRFCFTASLTRHRNLSQAEICGQVLAVQADLQQQSRSEPPKRIHNIVFMGMGEPLLNFEHVVGAAQTLLEPAGFDFSSRRVTISTAGIVPKIVPLGEALPTQLAVSLNATTDEVRTQIMPINKKWPIHSLIAAMRAYPLRARRRITVEYVLLQGINDSLDDARRLHRLLQDIPCKINLLPLNPHEKTVFAPPTLPVVQAFQKVLWQLGHQVLLRRARGQDIAAACGRLGPPPSPQTAIATVDRP